MEQVITVTTVGNKYDMNIAIDIANTKALMCIDTRYHTYFTHGMEYSLSLVESKFIGCYSSLEESRWVFTFKLVVGR